MPSTFSFSVAVVDAFGRIVPNSDITITYQPVANSGGHQHHDASRPKGVFEPESGNTGADGFLPVKYTAPQVSGLIFSFFDCRVPSGAPCIPAFGNVDVSIDLDALSRGDQVGQTATHPTNNYGLSSLQAQCRIQHLRRRDSLAPYGAELRRTTSMRRLCISLLVATALTAGRPVEAAVPPNSVIVRADADASYNPDTGLYAYTYSFTNDTSSPLASSLRSEIFRTGPPNPPHCRSISNSRSTARPLIRARSERP